LKVFAIDGGRFSGTYWGVHVVLNESETRHGYELPINQRRTRCRTLAVGTPVRGGGVGRSHTRAAHATKREPRQKRNGGDRQASTDTVPHMQKTKRHEAPTPTGILGSEKEGKCYMGGPGGMAANAISRKLETRLKKSQNAKQTGRIKKRRS